MKFIRLEPEGVHPRYVKKSDIASVKFSGNGTFVSLKGKEEPIECKNVDLLNIPGKWVFFLTEDNSTLFVREHYVKTVYEVNDNNTWVKSMVDLRMNKKNKECLLASTTPASLIVEGFSTK